MKPTSLRVNESVEGTSIEEKLFETIYNKQPIDNSIGAKAYNERKEGVIASRDMRTDRFEIAAEAMHKTAEMKRDGRAKKLQELKEKENPPKETDDKKEEVGKPESTPGNPNGTAKQ